MSVITRDTLCVLVLIVSLVSDTTGAPPSLIRLRQTASPPTSYSIPLRNWPCALPSGTFSLITTVFRSIRLLICSTSLFERCRDSENSLARSTVRFLRHVYLHLSLHHRMSLECLVFANSSESPAMCYCRRHEINKAKFLCFIGNSNKIQMNV